MIGLFGIDTTDLPKWLKILLPFIAVSILGYIFLIQSGLGKVPRPLDDFFSNTANVSAVIIFLIFGLVVYFIVSGGQEPKTNKNDNSNDNDNNTTT